MKNAKKIFLTCAAPKGKGRRPRAAWAATTGIPLFRPTRRIRYRPHRFREKNDNKKFAHTPPPLRPALACQVESGFRAGILPLLAAWDMREGRISEEKFAKQLHKSDKFLERDISTTIFL